MEKLQIYKKNTVEYIPLFKNKQIKCYDFNSNKKYIITDSFNLILYKT